MLEESEEYYNVNVDEDTNFVWESNRVESVGKNKFYLFFEYDIDRSTDAYYTVENDAPKKADIYEAESRHGISLLRGETEHIYYSADGTEYTGSLEDFYNYENGGWYPWYYINGEVGQISSCDIDISDIEKLVGYNTVDNDIRNAFYEKGFISVGQDGIGVKVQGMEPQESFFNEAGFFVINYMIECDWQHYDSNSADVVCTDYLIDDTGWICSGPSINYVSGHAMIAYNSGELELVYISWGLYKNARDKYPVLIESDFNSFEGLDYYKSH